MRSFVILAALAIAGSAHARGLDRHQVRVDLKTGAAKVTWSASGVAANTTRPKPRHAGGVQPSMRPVRLSRDGSVRHQDGAVVVRDAKGAVRARVPLVRRANEHVPWWVLLDDVAVFAWRHPSGKPAPDDYRDLWIAVALPSGTTLWRRDQPAHDPPGAVRVGDGAVAISGRSGVELIDARTGKRKRTLAKRGPFSAIASGAIIEAGDALHAVAADGTSRWRLDKRGSAVSWFAVRRDRTLVQTTERIYLIDTARGRIVWDAASPSRQPLWLAGDRLLAPRIERGRAGAVVRLQVRRVGDGRALGDHAVLTHTSFFDIGEVAVVGARGRVATLETSFLVLD